MPAEGVCFAGRQQMTIFVPAEKSTALSELDDEKMVVLERVSGTGVL